MFENISEDLKEEARAENRKRVSDRIEWLEYKIAIYLENIGLSEADFLAHGHDSLPADDVLALRSYMSERDVQKKFLHSISQ